MSNVFSNDNAKVTIKQLDTVVAAVTEASDNRFAKSADMGDLSGKDEVAYGDLAGSLKTTIDGKAGAATTLAGYGITDAYTKAEIDGKLTSAYKAAGSITAAQLTSALLVAANEGKVYNVSDDLTTTADFVEGAGHTHGTGANVAVIEATPADNSDPGNPVAATYKFDVIAGFVDLSGYAQNADVAVATAADISAIVNGLYSSGNGNGGE